MSQINYSSRMKMKIKHILLHAAKNDLVTLDVIHFDPLLLPSHISNLLMESLRLWFNDADVVTAYLIQNSPPFAALVWKRGKEFIHNSLNPPKPVVKLNVVVNRCRWVVGDFVAEVPHLCKCRAVGFDLLEEMSDKGDVNVVKGGDFFSAILFLGLLIPKAVSSDVGDVVVAPSTPSCCGKIVMARSTKEYQGVPRSTKFLADFDLEELLDDVIAAEKTCLKSGHENTVLSPVVGCHFCFCSEWLHHICRLTPQTV